MDTRETAEVRMVTAPAFWVIPVVPERHQVVLKLPAAIFVTLVRELENVSCRCHRNPWSS